MRRGLHNYLPIAAFTVGTILVAQMTWAIVEEGESQHQADISTLYISLLAKVRIEEYCRTSHYVVTPYQQSTLNIYKYVITPLSEIYL